MSSGRPTRATMTSYYVRALFVVTPFHAFHPSAFSLILSDYLQESNTHGVGLFAVKDIKAGDFTDIDCFGTFVLHNTKTEVHDAIAADGVPRYMVASMCRSGEVLCPHPALFFVPLPCCFWWYMNSCGSDLVRHHFPSLVPSQEFICVPHSPSPNPTRMSSCTTNEDGGA